MENSFLSMRAVNVRSAVANGRIIFLSTDEVWDSADFATLCVHEKVTRGAKVTAIVSNSSIVLPDPDEENQRDFCEFSKGISRSDVTNSFVNNIVTVASSILGTYTSIDDRRSLPESKLQGKHCMIRSIPSDNAVSGTDVVALLDPVSDAAQRVAPLLLTLRDRLGASIRLYLNPGTQYRDNPLKSFYRFVAPGSQYYVPQKTRSGSLERLTPDHALFTELPGNPVTLTTEERARIFCYFQL